MTLPTAAKPQQGVFVYRRLQAISKIWPVHALRPQPWFPGVRPYGLEQPLSESALKVDARRMFYLPGIAKFLDSWWMERCLQRWLQRSLIPRPGAVLDAHFAYPEGVACHRIAEQLGLPFFITLRGVEEEWLQIPAVRRQIVRALNAAAGVISVSQSLRNAVEKFGVNAAAIQVIPNGCDRRTFSPGNKLVARQKLKIDQSKTLLVTVANLKPVKGHDTLIRAVGRLPQTLDFELVCIGESEQSHFVRRLQQLAIESGVMKRVRFIGPLAADSVADYLRAADLFVLASRREGCCNAILEAMACGVPIVATAVGDNPVYASRYGNFRMSPPDDPLAFSEELQQSLASSRIGSGTTEDRYRPPSWDDVAAECVSYIKQQLGLMQRNSETLSPS